MKANLIVNKNNEIVGYRTYPLNEAEPMVELDEAPENFICGGYKYENHKIVKKELSTNTQTIVKNKYSKESLIKAFNEYRNNVNYGVIKEDESTHQLVLNWYSSLINNDINSINNPPQVITKYMEDNSWI